MSWILHYQSESCEHSLVGGKARNLWLLGRLVDCPVPPWFVVTTSSFDAFINVSLMIRSYVIMITHNQTIPIRGKDTIWSTDHIALLN